MGDMLIVNPPSSTPLFSVGAPVEATDEIVIAERESPVTAFVDLDEMSLLQFRAIEAGWAQPLIRAEGGAILLAGEVNAQQIAILPFDLRDSNLPLLIAWPVLMANLMDWFSPSDIVSLPEGLTVGDVLVIAPPLLADSIRITTPDGHERELPVDADKVAFADTGKLGLYRLEILQAGEVTSRQSFAVNLFCHWRERHQAGGRSRFAIGRRATGCGRGRAAGHAGILDVAGAGGAAATCDRVVCLSPAAAGADDAQCQDQADQISMAWASKFLSLITDSSDFPASV